MFNKQGPTNLGIERLLNIAHMSLKYSVASYEDWAIDQIYQLAQDPNSFLRHGSSELCAKALNVAFLSGNAELFNLVERRLVARMLWGSIDCRPIRAVAEHQGLQRLRGVAYYKELITSTEGSKDCASPDGSEPAATKNGMARARSKLRALILALPDSPTHLNGSLCPLHTRCTDVWKASWREASAFATEKHPQESVDVLGILKSMMLDLKESLPERSGISVACTLQALESLTLRRDAVVDALLSFFIKDS